MPKIVCNQFKKMGEEGDFSWMIRQPQHIDSLFIFNDDVESVENCKAGKGNAVIRTYNQYNKHLAVPRSAGIPTGTRKAGGFKSLDETSKKHVDDAVYKIVELNKKFKYDKIFYSGDDSGGLATCLFDVDKSVKHYITLKLISLDS